MMILSIIMIPGVLLACIGLILSIGVMDGTTPAPSQHGEQPGSHRNTMPPADLVRLD
jgi:hypothetical protein